MTRTPAAPAPFRDRGRLAAVGIVAAALLSHLPALGNGFVLDDHLLIEANEILRAPLALGQIWLGGFWGHAGLVDYYRPLVTQSFALNFLVGGLSPFGYHLANLLLHAGASLLLYRLAGRWLGPGPAPAVAAMLFAVHPLGTEPVASVYGRPDLMAALLVLAALLLQERWRSGSRGVPGAVGVAALYGLALMSKESALLLPVLLVSDVYWHD